MRTIPVETEPRNPSSENWAKLRINPVEIEPEYETTQWKLKPNRN